MVVFKRTNIKILNDKIRELDQNKDNTVSVEEVKAVLKPKKDKTIGKGINEMDRPTNLVKLSKDKKIPFINTLTLTRCKASKIS